MSQQLLCFFFQAEDGIRDLVRSRGLGDVYKRQAINWTPSGRSQPWAATGHEASCRYGGRKQPVGIAFAPTGCPVLIVGFAADQGDVTAHLVGCLWIGRVYDFAAGVEAYACLLYTSPSP